MDNCTKVPFKKDLLVKSKNNTLDRNTEIVVLEANRTFKYEVNGINNTVNEEK